MAEYAALSFFVHVILGILTGLDQLRRYFPFRGTGVIALVMGVSVLLWPCIWALESLGIFHVIGMDDDVERLKRFYSEESQ